MKPTNQATGMDSAVDVVVVPRSRDLGGFEVRRALPSSERRMVGPFVFLDQMGPARLKAGSGIDVRPHPHIGLSTVTYLFEGEILHRDSLGSVQPIRPGEVNWMTAGSGIVHSERTPPEVRQHDSALFGLQCWVALPEAREETGPGFVHVGRQALPIMEAEGAQLRLIVGTLFGARSPVPTLSELFYAEAALAPGAQLELPPEHEERAIYVVEGELDLGRDGRFDSGRLVVLRPGATVVLGAHAPARVMLLGGASMDGPRHVWWNFVSSSTDRIEQAAGDWRAGNFPRIPEETEFIPLPEHGPAWVSYP